MARMIRKFVYLTAAQTTMLASLAEARGVSQSEVVHQAIEHEAQKMEREAYKWNRSDAYADRLDRFGREDDN